jgi:hypothetical protein
MWVFLTGVAIWAILVGTFLIKSVRRGSWLGAVAASLLASPAPIAVLAKTMEHRSLLYLVAHFQDLSFAFFFGDLVFLPFSAAMAALAWKHSPELKATWATSWWWTVISVIVGLLAAYWFRYLNDMPRYEKAGAMGSFDAPTKLFHDFGAYPVLFGGLFCIAVPLFVEAVNSNWPFVHFYAAPYVGWVLLGVGLWFAVGLVHDSGLFGPPLDPKKLHPNSWVWPKVSAWRWLRGPLA